MSDALVQSATIQLKAQAGGGFGSVPDGAPIDQITINGSGFGSAPNVVLFARLEDGTVGEVVALDSPEIGAWSTVSEGDNGALPRYKELDGVTGFAMRDDTISPYTNNKYLAQCIIDNLPPNSEYRLSYRVGMPFRANNLGGYFPAGATQHSTIVDSVGSAWKIAWMCNSDYAGRGIEGNKGGPNLCVPTAIGNNLIVQGNYTSARSNSPDSLIYYNSYGFPWGEWSTVSYYQKPDSSDPIAGTNGLIERSHTSTGASWNAAKAGNPYNDTSGTLTDPNYRSLVIPGWFGDNTGSPDFTKVQALYGGIYLAVGANSRARLVLADSNSISTATKVSELAVIPANGDAWSDTQIKVTPTAWEKAGCTHWIVQDANGVEQSGVLV